MGRSSRSPSRIMRGDMTQQRGQRGQRGRPLALPPPQRRAVGQALQTEERSRRPEADRVDRVDRRSRMTIDRTETRERMSQE